MDGFLYINLYLKCPCINKYTIISDEEKEYIE